jgi:uncharacterized protein (TIGR02147 family)
MGLTPKEKTYFKGWIDKLYLGDSHEEITQGTSIKRKNVSNHILKDWLNIYVKDAFQLPEVSQTPEKIFSMLGGIASRSRIEKSIKFLLANGYLRKNQNNQIVLDTPLAVADGGIPSKNIRQFHKASLKIASDAIEQYPMSERTANAMVLLVDDEEYQELAALAAEFAEKLQRFSENKKPSSSKRLYQALVNISPTGGNS